jgi:hypothetical protein
MWQIGKWSETKKIPINAKGYNSFQYSVHDKGIKQSHSIIFLNLNTSIVISKRKKYFILQYKSNE